MEKLRKDPDRLKMEIMAYLKRAAEYRVELKRKDRMSFEIDELVYNSVSPADITIRGVSDPLVYEQIMDWATEIS